MLLASGTANFGVNMTGFLRGTKQVRDEMTKIRQLKATIQTDVTLRTGAISKVKADAKEKLAAASKGVNMQVGIDFKAGAVAKIESQFNSLVKKLGNKSAVKVGVNIDKTAVNAVRNLTTAVARLDALGSAMRVINVGVTMKPGTTTTLKLLGDQLRKLTGKKWDIKVALQVDPALMAMLRQMAPLLDQAAKNADRLRNSLRNIPPRALNPENVRGYDSALGHLVNTVRRFLVGYLGVKLLIDGFRALKAAAIDYNVTLQQTTTTLTAMLDNNAQKAKEVVKEIQAFAEKTPYNFAETLPIVTQLRLAKIEADGLVPALNALGNVAATTGNGADGIARMAASLRDMNARGRITGEEVREMSRQAIPVYEYIAKSWKISTAQAQEYVRKGMIPAKQATDAILKNAAADPKFMGRLEQMSQTLPGALSNIGDILQRVIGGAFEKSFNSLTKFMLKIAEFVATNEFKDWAEAFLRGVFAVFSMLGKIIGFVWNAFVTLYGWISSVINFFGQFEIVGTASTAAIRYAIALLVAGIIRGLVVAIVTATISVVSFAASAVAGFIGLSPYLKIAILLLIAYATNWYGLRDTINDVVISAMRRMQDLATSTAKAIEFLSKIPGASAILGDQTGLAATTFEEWNQKIIAVRNSLEKVGDTLDKNKGEVEGLWNSISQGLDVSKLADAWVKAGQDAGKKVKGKAGEIPDYSNQFTKPKDDGKKKKTDAQRAAEKEGREALKREKDALKDNATAWAQYAKAVVESAKAQINAYKELRNTLSDFFSEVQSKFVALGIVNDPMGPMIRSFERLLGLGDKMKGVAAYVAAINKEANRVRKEAGEKVELASGLDGVTPDSGVGVTGRASVAATSATGMKIAQNAERIQEKYGSKLESAFHKSCDRLADLTVRGATSAYNKIMGPREGDTAKATMRRFMNAGIGQRVTPGMSLAPGGLLYSSTLGGTSGHVQTIGTNGDRLDQYGRNAMKLKNFQWYVPPPGAMGSSLPSAGKVGLQKQVGVKPTLANLQGQNLDEILGADFSNSLSKVTAISKAWGKVVGDTKDSQIRFSLQTRLTTKEFNAQIGAIAGATQRVGESMDSARNRTIQWFRSFANSADFLLNRIGVIRSAEEGIRNARKAIQDAKTADDPMAALAYERRGEQEKFAGMANSKNKNTAAVGRRGLDTLGWEQNALREQIITQMNMATEKAIKLANRQAEAQGKVDAMMGPSTQAMADYAHEVEIAGIRAKVYEEYQKQIESSDQSVSMAAITDFAKKFNSEVSATNASHVRNYAKAVNEAKIAINDKNSTAQRELELMKNFSFSSDAISRIVDAETAARTAYNEAIKANQDAITASTAAVEAFNQSLKETDHKKAVEGVKALRDAYESLVTMRDSAAGTLNALTEKFDFDPEQARMIAQADLEAKTRSRIRGGENVNFDQTVKDGMEEYDSKTLISDASEMNKVVSEAAKSTATWADTTATAAMQFEIVQGRFKQYGEDVKAALLQSVKTTEANKIAAQQLGDAQGAALEVENELYSRSIAGGKELTEVQKIQVKWRLEDAKVAALAISLTAEQTQKIEEARAKLIELLEKQDDNKKLDKITEASKQFLDNLHGVFSEAFGRIYKDGFGGFMDSMLDGVRDMLNKMASEILASYALKMLVQMIPGMGEYYGSMGAASQGILGQAVQQGVGALTSSQNRSSATGQMLSASPVYQAGGDVNYNYNIDRVAADDPTRFAEEVSKLSRADEARHAADVVDYGRTKR